MGLNPPKDLEDDPEIDENGNILLQDSDIDTVFVDVSIPLHLFGGSEDLTDGTTLCYTTYGYQFTVEESTEEITSYVEYLSMSWWEHFRLDTKILFENIFSRKNK